MKTEDLKQIKWPAKVADVRAHIERLGIPQTEAARLLRIDPRTMRTYVSETDGKKSISKMPFASYVVLSTLKR